MSEEQLLDVPYELHGSVDAICDTLRERRARFGISYIVVFEMDIDRFAPVVERLTGA